MVNPKTGARRRGRPEWEPSKEERLMVEVAVANGFTQTQIATLLKKDEKTLRKYCAEELDGGAVKAGVKISGALFTKAMKGDTGAMIWWEKTRRGMSDRTKYEHTFDITKLTDEELEALERIRARLSTQP